MKTGMWVLIGVVVIVALVGIYAVSSYNGFVTKDQKIEAQWSEVENQYQRQADLIPNLVSVVSSAVRAETNFVQGVVNARTQFQNAQGQVARDQAGLQMVDSVATFVAAVAESYPVLQANTQYVALTDELAGTQNRITTARGRYIEYLQEYNVAIKRFPSNILASMFGFEEKEYYHAAPGSLTTPSLGNAQLP